MKRIGLAALTLLEIIGFNNSAVAADLPMPFKNEALQLSPPARWNGFYLA